MKALESTINSFSKQIVCTSLIALLILNANQASSLDFGPLVDDWMISDAIPLGGTLDRDNFDVASCGEDYLVAWVEYDPDLAAVAIFGVGVGSSGNVLSDSRFRIDAPGNTGELKMQVASDGRDYLVAWVESNDDQDYRLMAARVSRTGAVLDPEGIEIRTQSYPTLINGDFDVESNGSHYLISWGERISGDQNSRTVFAVRVDARGFIEEQSPIVLAQPAGLEVSVSNGVGGSFRVIGWGESTLTTAIDVGADGSVIEVVGDYLPGNQSFGALAFNGSQHFAVWSERTVDGSKRDIVGSVLPTPLAITTPVVVGINRTHDLQGLTSVASNGGNFFVVWLVVKENSRELYGSRISSTGEILDPNSLPVDLESGIQRARVASNGKSYLVAMVDNGANNRQITARLIINPDTFPIFVSSPAIAQDGSVSFDLTAAPGGSFEVQYSDDLNEWFEHATFLNFSGDATVTDSTPSPTGQRFYRAKKLNP